MRGDNVSVGCERQYLVFNKFGSWLRMMKPAVMKAINVRRRLLFIINAASQPRKWYVTAVTINTRPASKGKVINREGPMATTDAMHSPIIAGTNAIKVMLTNELR